MKILIIAPTAHISSKPALNGFYTGSEINQMAKLSNQFWKGTRKLLSRIKEGQCADYFFVFGKRENRCPKIWYSKVDEFLKVLVEAEKKNTRYDIIISYHAMEQKGMGNGFGASLKDHHRPDWSLNLASHWKNKLTNREIDIWKLKHGEMEYEIYDCLNPASADKRKENNFESMKEVAELIKREFNEFRTGIATCHSDRYRNQPL